MDLKEEDLLRLGPWSKGINNRADETTVPKDQLRAAVNVDITALGNPRTRPGSSKKLAGTGCHSWWSKDGYPYGVFVDSNTLKVVNTNFQVVASIRSGLKPAQPVSYACVNNTVFWSNGFDNGSFGLGLVDQPFGLAAPIGTPTVTATTNDSLTGGVYQVAITFATNTGEESGSTLAALVTVPDSGGISLTNIPQSPDSRVSVIRVYISPPNGDELYWVDDVPSGTTSLTIGILPELGKQLQTQFHTAMPPGQIVRYFNGRLWVASGNIVWHGSPFHYGQVWQSKGYIVYPDNVTLMEPAGQADEGGMFIAAGKRTFYLPASSDKVKPYAKQVIAHPFGAVPGTGLSVPGWWFDPALKTEAAYWMDTDGVPILGTQGGGIRALTVDEKGVYYQGPVADSGASLIRDIDGIRQVITNLRGAGVNNAVATDALVATVYRNGVAI